MVGGRANLCNLQLWIGLYFYFCAWRVANLTMWVTWCHLGLAQEDWDNYWAHRVIKWRWGEVVCHCWGNRNIQQQVRGTGMGVQWNVPAGTRPSQWFFTIFLVFFFFWLWLCVFWYRDAQNAKCTRFAKFVEPYRRSDIYESDKTFYNRGSRGDISVLKSFYSAAQQTSCKLFGTYFGSFWWYWSNLSLLTVHIYIADAIGPMAIWVDGNRNLTVWIEKCYFHFLYINVFAQVQIGRENNREKLL